MSQPFKQCAVVVPRDAGKAMVVSGHCGCVSHLFRGELDCPSLFLEAYMCCGEIFVFGFLNRYWLAIVFGLAWLVGGVALVVYGLQEDEPFSYCYHFFSSEKKWLMKFSEKGNWKKD